MLRNTGREFVDVTTAAGIKPHGRWSTGAGFVDVDLDGDLDVWVVRYVRYSPEADISRVAGLDQDAQKGLALALADKPYKGAALRHHVRY